MSKNNKNQVKNAVFSVQLVKSGNKFKLAKAKVRGGNENQFFSWVPTNSRNLARLLKRSQLVTR